MEKQTATKQLADEHFALSRGELPTPVEKQTAGKFDRAAKSAVPATLVERLQNEHGKYVATRGDGPVGIVESLLGDALAELRVLRATCEHAEAVMTVIEPRSDSEEYAKCLLALRAVIAKGAA